MYVFLFNGELRLIYAENCEKLCAFWMKYGFLPILGVYSPGLCLIIIHSRNKLICYDAFGMVLLFAENRLKIMYFWIWSNPAINKTKAHKPFPSIKLSSMKFLPSSIKTKMGGVAAITPSFSFSNKFRLLNYVCCDHIMVLFSNQKCIGPTSTKMTGLFVCKIEVL